MESAVDEPLVDTALTKQLPITLERVDNKKSTDPEPGVMKVGGTKPVILKTSSDPLRAERITVKLVSNGNRMEPKRIAPPRISFADAISGIEAKHHEIVLQKVSKRKSIQTPLKDFSECEGISGKSQAQSLPKTKRLSTNLSTDTEDSSSKEEGSKEKTFKRKIVQTISKPNSEEPLHDISLKEKHIDVATNSDTNVVAKADKKADSGLTLLDKSLEVTKRKKAAEDIAARVQPLDACGKLSISHQSTSFLKDFKPDTSNGNDESFSYPKRSKHKADSFKLSVDNIYPSSSDSESDSFPKSAATKDSSKVIHSSLPPGHSETFSSEKSVHTLEKKSMGSSSEQPLFVDDRLPEGWSRELCQRQGGLTAGKYDVYIRNSTGKKFRSRNEIRNYVEHLGLDLNADDFDFTVFGKFPNSSKKRRRPTKNLVELNASSSPSVEKVTKKFVKRIKNVEADASMSTSPSPYFSCEEGTQSKKKKKLSVHTTPETVIPVIGVQKWTPPRSPYNLIQENLYHNTWQLLVGTILLNKSSVFDGDILGKSATPIIYDFFEKWPTPESVADVDPAVLAQIIKPLGLHQKRARTIKRFSVDFLTKEWLYPNELYGIGKYGNDSFRMFCINEWRSVKPFDPMLTVYRNWLSTNWRYLPNNSLLADNS